MRRIVDLTMPLHKGDRGVDWKTSCTLEKDGWNARTLELYTHCGTHVEAPSHFLPDAETVDELPLELLTGPARVINLEPVRAREELTVERVSPWADRIEDGGRILLRSGWSRRLGAEDYYTSNPRLSPGLAQWLVDQGVTLVGVEPHSIADTSDPQRCAKVHEILLSAGVVIVEGLCSLDALSRDLVEFIVLPLPIEDGDGSPARAIAFEEDAPA